MKKDFDLVVFDLDGTLIDSLDDLTAAANHARAQFSLPSLTAATVRTFIGNGATALMALVLPGLHEKERARGLQAFLDYYAGHLLDKTILYPGIASVLARRGRCTLAVLTNKMETHSRSILAGLGVLDAFTFVWGSDTMHVRKPSPDALMAMMHRLNVAPGRTLMIGDGVADIRCARAAGTSVIAVGYGYSDPERLKELKPDGYYQRPQELLEAPCFG